MKKGLLLLLSVLLVFGIIGASVAGAAGDPTFVVSTATANPGETVTITISTENNPGIASCALTMTYDESRLEWIDAAPGIFPGMYDLKHPETGVLTNPLTWAYYANDSSNGVFVTLTFKVKEDAAPGDAQVTVSYDPDYVFNMQDENVAFAITPGKVTVNDTSVHVTDVSVSPATLELEKGKNATLTATVTPDNATDQTVTWTSSDENVATVDADGKVTAKAKGNVTITATSNDDNTKKAECAVTVVVPATSISVNPTSLEMVKGGNPQTVTAEVLPADTSDKVTWSSDNTSVATVADGVVTPVGKGTANITATAGSYSATCAVTVTVPVTGVTLDKTSLDMKKDETAALKATVNPTDASNTKVAWSSSNENVATVDANGNVTAKGDGTATITVTTEDGNKTATCAVTVTVPVESVEVAPSELKMVVGDTSDPLTATVTPDDASNTEVTWSSSNESVATVDANGVVTAKAVGDATITATSKADSNKKDTCAVTVSARPVPATAISLDPTTLEMKVGEEQTITADVDPDDTTDNVTWTSSDPSKVTVDQNGKVTAVAATGDASAVTITASANDNVSATCTVTVVKGDQTITAENMTLTFGDTAKINATTSGNGTLSYTVTEGDDVISVADDGTITTLKAGPAKVKITAAETPEYNAAEKEITVTVEKAKVDKPTASDKTFTYNGNEQTYPVAENDAYTVENNKQINAGDYQVTVALADKDNTTWADGSTDDLSFDFSIAKKELTITANSKTAKVGDKKPELAATDYKVTGLVGSDKLTTEPTLEYASEPDMTKAGSVAIKASGADAGDNYTIKYVDGKLTIEEKSSGGNSGSGTSNKVTVDDADNGSVSVSPEKAKKGQTVTVTPDPDEGYELDDLTVTDKNGKSIPVKKNSDGTYSFTMPDGPVTVTPSFREANCPSKPYKDVDTSKWYHEAVDYAIANGLMNGVSSTAFAPDGTLSRAMLVTILYRLEGQPAAAGENPFDDVADGTWYTDAVIWANANGIVKGFGDGTFLPDANITREQMAAIIYRYAQFKGYDVSKTTDISGYNDASSVSDWALDAMKWANATGLITGRSAKTLAPEGNTTRAEAAAILMRFIENNK